MNEFYETLKRALVIAGTNPTKALEMIEACLQKARERGDTKAVCLLARNAGIICSKLSQLSMASQYYEEVLKCNPENAYDHFAAGRVHEQLGRDAEARAAYKRSQDLAESQGDADLVQMVLKANARL